MIQQGMNKGQIGFVVSLVLFIKLWISFCIRKLSCNCLDITRTLRTSALDRLALIKYHSKESWDRQGREPLGEKDDTISKKIVVNHLCRLTFMWSRVQLKWGLIRSLSGQKHLTQRPMVNGIVINYLFSGIASLIQ